MVLGLRCDEDGQPVSMAVGPGQTPEPRTLAAQLAKVTSRFGATVITLVGDRGMLKGQHIAALGQHGGQDMPAMTTPPMANLRRPGTLHMALLAQALAEGLTAEGLRDVLRRTPGRAHAVRDTRHAHLAALQVQVAQQNHSRTAHPRAKAQGAVPQRVAHATPLRLAAWVERTLEERPIPWTVQTNAPQEAATLEGCSGLQTALTPQHAPTALVPDRYKDGASVAHAFRTCTTAPLAVRPSFLRRAARTQAPAVVGMLASQSLRSLASGGSAFDGTVAAGLHALTTRCLVEVAPQNAPSAPGLPPPRDAIARCLHRADIKLPKVFALSGVRGSTKKKLQSERLQQCIQLRT